MVEKINHYSLENKASVYDEEALTALELAARTAAKVNAAIEQVNENEEKITEAAEYMTDNLPKFVEKSLADMEKNGDLEGTILSAISRGKVDKGGNEQITYKMLAQDVKEAMTGGNTPVVGANAVNTSNVADNAITEAKLTRSLRNITMHTTDAGMTTPLIVIDTNAGVYGINGENTETYHLYTQTGALTLDGTAGIDGATYYNPMEAAVLYYNATTNVIYLTNFNGQHAALRDCFLLGWVNGYRGIVDVVVPVELNGVMYEPRGVIHTSSVPRGTLPTKSLMARYDGTIDNVVWDFSHYENGDIKVTVKNGGKYLVMVGHEYIEIDLTNAGISTTGVKSTSTTMWSYYDDAENKICFRESSANIPNHWIYLGVILLNMPYASDCIFPYSVDDTYLYFPYKHNRADGKILYRPLHYSSTTKPYIDYDNLRLVFPCVRNLFVTSNNAYYSIVSNTADTGYNDYVVELNASYNFIVGGATGIRALTNTEFADLKTSTDKDNYFYFGTILGGDRHSNLNFETCIGASVSILGDSISANQRDIPEGNNHYYNTDTPAMWYSHAAREIGLYLDTVNAYAGLRVTNTGSATTNGMEFAKNLGENPSNIIVYLGVNDWGNEVPLGTYDGTGELPTNGATFREAYAIMLNNIMAKYPSAKVYACTLVVSRRNNVEAPIPGNNADGVHISKFNEAIREIATNMNVEVIELATAIPYNGGAGGYFHDYNAENGYFLHPSNEGHRAIGRAVAQAMSITRRYL